MNAKLLGMYLGCKFRYRYVDWEKDSWSPITTLKGRDIDKMQDLSIDKIQLLLRPLSSMTEEERLEVSKLIPKGESELWVKNIFNVTQWYLDRYFDVDGLIESGDAIDSTKELVAS